MEWVAACDSELSPPVTSTSICNEEGVELLTDIREISQCPERLQLARAFSLVKMPTIAFVIMNQLTHYATKLFKHGE